MKRNAPARPFKRAHESSDALRPLVPVTSQSTPLVRLAAAAMVTLGVGDLGCGGEPAIVELHPELAKAPSAQPSARPEATCAPAWMPTPPPAIPASSFLPSALPPGKPAPTTWPPAKDPIGPSFDSPRLAGLVSIGPPSPSIQAPTPFVAPQRRVEHP